MSAFREAVAEWNRRFKDDGWRSASQHDIDCPRCKQPRLVTVTTIHGKTTAACSCCGFGWDVAP